MNWFGWLPATKADITKLEKLMAIKTSDLQTKFDSLSAQLDKATAEILAEIKKLTDALGNTEIPDAAQASLDALTTKVQALDDLNPDQPPTPPTP